MDSSGAGALSLKPEDAAYQEFLHKCGDREYTGSLYVDTHLYAVASPLEQAEAEGCPFLVAHSVFGKEEENCGGGGGDGDGDGSDSSRNETPVARKELLVWSDKLAGESLFDSEGMLPFGTFKASTLADAYERAEAASRGPGGGANGVYDVIANNCGDFVIHLASILGLQIDASVTSFVARRLVVESGKALVDRIRNSMHYKSLFSSGDCGKPARQRHLVGSTTGTGEQQRIVETLVQSKASELYADP